GVVPSMSASSSRRTLVRVRAKKKAPGQGGLTGRRKRGSCATSGGRWTSAGGSAEPLQLGGLTPAGRKLRWAHCRQRCHACLGHARGVCPLYWGALNPQRQRLVLVTPSRIRHARLKEKRHPVMPAKPAKAEPVPPAPEP